MPSHTLEGIIIKRNNVGEADRLITLFCRDQGKVAILAKGVRKTSSRRAGSLELFNQVRVQISDKAILTEVQVVNTFSTWRQQLGRVTIAYQLCEFVDKLTAEHQPHNGVYAILCEALGKISRLGTDWRADVEAWLIRMLVDLGYWPADERFAGDVWEFVESLSNRRLNSHRMLNKLK